MLLVEAEPEKSDLCNASTAAAAETSSNVVHQCHFQSRTHAVRVHAGPDAMDMSDSD